MKEFEFAVEQIAESTDAYPFTIPDPKLKEGKKELIAFKPGDGQLAMLMMALGRHTSYPTRVAGIIDFFVEIMDEPSADYVAGRLLSRKDPFGLTEVQQIIEWLVEEWTARPTKSSSGSTSSPPSDGPRSTVTTTAPTYSDSPPIGS